MDARGRAYKFVGLLPEEKQHQPLLAQRHALPLCSLPPTQDMCQGCSLLLLPVCTGDATTRTHCRALQQGGRACTSSPSCPSA